MSVAAGDSFELLFEHAPCGFLVFGTDGGLVRVNSTFCDWSGQAFADLHGKRFRDLLTLPGRIFYETNITALLTLNGGFEEVALDMLTASKGTLPVLANASQLPDDGGLLVTVFRTPERRRYERALRGRLENEKETSVLREQFIAVLGHDLRNPLASIVGAARLLRREAQSEKAQRVIELMESSVDRMAGLIDDVMDFARGRLGSGIAVTRALQPLEPTLRQVVAELEAADPSRHIHCSVEVAQPVSFDANRLGQLVSNLLGNALTHGDPKQAVQVHAELQGENLHLWVANAGPAIPPAVMSKLFQPFFRGEARPSQQGLGLGLHIAEEIARAHGGALSVQSDDHKTRFTLVMPAFSDESIAR